jgi:hypothetical protein
MLAKWTVAVVPSDMSLRGPDMSLDMGPVADSEDTAGLVRSKSLAVFVSGTLGLCGRQARPP